MGKETVYIDQISPIYIAEQPDVFLLKIMTKKKEIFEIVLPSSIAREVAYTYILSRGDSFEIEKHNEKYKKQMDKMNNQGKQQ